MPLCKVCKINDLSNRTLPFFARTKRVALRALPCLGSVCRLSKGLHSPSHRNLKREETVFFRELQTSTFPPKYPFSADVFWKLRKDCTFCSAKNTLLSDGMGVWAQAINTAYHWTKRRAMGGPAIELKTRRPATSGEQGQGVSPGPRHPGLGTPPTLDDPAVGSLY